MKDKWAKTVGLTMLMGCVAFVSANALLIDPSESYWVAGINMWNGDDLIPPDGALKPLSQAQVESILGLAPGDLTEVYKSEVGGPELESLADSYDTVYNPSSDPEGATITYVTGEPSVSSTDLIYLGVKDGEHAPYWYVFDLTGQWDGVATMTLRNFWPDNGAISHISIFTGDSPGGNVPDGGTTIALLGLGLAALGVSKRFIAG